MRVDLGDDREIYVEVGIESFEGDIGAERTIFPFVAETEGGNTGGFSFSHEHDWVENARDGG